MAQPSIFDIGKPTEIGFGLYHHTFESESQQGKKQKALTDTVEGKKQKALTDTVEGKKQKALTDTVEKIKVRLNSMDQQKLFNNVKGCDDDRVDQRAGESITDIKNCYDNAWQKSDVDLAEMFAMDACYILEFFDRAPDNNSMTKVVMDDIFVFGNQIPLCVLLKIMELKCDSKDSAEDRFARMLTDHLPFHCLFPFAVSREEIIIPCLKELLKDNRCHHLLHLLSKSIQDILSRNQTQASQNQNNRYHYLLNWLNSSNHKFKNLLSKGTQAFQRVAQNLLGSSIQINRQSRATRAYSFGGMASPVLPLINRHYSLANLHEYNITFEPDRRVWFQSRWRPLSSILHLPPIHLHKDAVSLLWNLMQFSLKKKDEKLISDLMFLLLCIVNDKSQELLCKRGIIQGRRSSDVNFFQRIEMLCVENSIIHPGAYLELVEDLDRHCKSGRGRWIASVKEKFSLWATVSVSVSVGVAIASLLLDYLKNK